MPDSKKEEVTTTLDELMREPETELEKQISKLAEAMIGFHDTIKEIVKDLPDEAFGPLIAECRRESLPDESKNFPIPEWETIAEQIEFELGMRRQFRRAAACGAAIYCPTHDMDAELCAKDHD